MDCETARRRMEEGEAGPALEQHLQRCAACRGEAEFDRHLAAAVAAMPRVPAPEALRHRVMEALTTAPASRAARRRPLALRPWEIGWIGAACLLLIVLLTALLPWRSWGATLLSLEIPPRVAWPHSAGAAAAVLRSELAAVFGQAGLDPTRWSGVPAAWLGGAVGFMLGLFFLLSWQERGAGRNEWEDAHA